MLRVLFLSLGLLLGNLLHAQGRANDIPAKQLPKEVAQVLDDYLTLLRAQHSLEQTASEFEALAGGDLVNEDGTLRSSIMPFSLKKDWNNVKFYAQPHKITRVNRSPVQNSGYGPTAIRGHIYKIWIDKADKKNGMPAPISIMLPEGHPEINTPKVIGIGSL